jgi:signal transduction histidine kinase
VFGYMVDLGWAREHYFAQLTSEVAAIDGAGQGLRFTIALRNGAAIVGPLAPPESDLPMATREFPMTFFDPLLVTIDPPSDLLLTSALATAIADNDITLATAERGARRTLVLAGVTAVVLIAGLVLSLQAGRATTRLAEMRSDFVSAVTHELKAPIANLRAIHQTLASGRLDAGASREYAQMGVREATRLGRLVENLLAYARVTDVADLYTFESVPLKRVVDDSVQEFAAHLADANFELRVDVPDSLPPVHADPVALELLLNNLIDNAIRYSTAERVLTISARDAGGQVVMSVADRGIGIADEDRAHVTKKFFRGRHPGAAGSGLGLAIVDRIVKDHAGTLEINSTEGKGTTVVISLPRAA